MLQQDQEEAAPLFLKIAKGTTIVQVRIEGANTIVLFSLALKIEIHAILQTKLSAKHMLLYRAQERGGGLARARSRA